MIGQPIINVSSGGRTRLAATSAAIFLLCFILFVVPVIEQIPLAALVGVMFMVVIGTFAWNTSQVMRRVPRFDAIVIVLVTVITVLTDLATAVVTGVIVSAQAYAWQNATRIGARTFRTDDEGAKIYQIQGSLFSGSADGFSELFQVEKDPDHVIANFEHSRVADQPALAASETMADRYAAADKRLVLRHLSRDCHALLRRTGQLVVESDDDSSYGVAVDYDIRPGALGGGH